MAKRVVNKLSQLADVSIQNILDEQGIRWNSLLGEFRASPMCITIVSSGDGTDGNLIWDGTKWAYTAATQQLAGVIVLPQLTNLGSGTISVGSGVYSLFTTIVGSGRVSYNDISGGTWTLTDQATNYVLANYNNGSPQLSVSTNVSDINSVTSCPIYTIFRDGNSLYILNWDHEDSALANKLNRRLIKTERFTRESGLMLSVTSTGSVQVSPGNVWYGGNSVTLGSYNSAVSGMIYYKHVSGVWTTTSSGTLELNQYDDGTNIQVLQNSNRWYINWIYRVISESSDVFVVLASDSYSSQTAASAASPPANLPSVITNFSFLVGRAIGSKGSQPTQIDSAFSVVLPYSSVIDHNSLSGLQGGTTGEYYHLSNSQYLAATLGYPTYAFSALTSSTVLDGTYTIVKATTAGTVGRALQIARAQGRGNWVLDPASNTFTLYDTDGTTVVATFALSPVGGPYKNRATTNE